MPIQSIDDSQASEYERFRARMWPRHSAAGQWPAARLKYLLNPQSVLCPGSGLYGYFSGGKIVGCMGAYPMPVTVNGAVHPGHMMVDWAVLPEFQFTPIAGRLWQSLLALPGRKFGSTGTRDSQGPLERRAVKIPAMSVTGIVNPVEAAALRYLRLMPYLQPLPLDLEQLSFLSGVTFCGAGDIESPLTAAASNEAGVIRDEAFWKVYLDHRNYNGAIALQIDTVGKRSVVVFVLLGAGRFRVATLLWLSCSPVAADACGKLFGSTLRRLKVCVLLDNYTSDKTRAAFLKAAVPWQKIGESYWWAIEKPEDSFRVGDVKWRLTAMDRDGHWGGVQPSGSTR